MKLILIVFCTLLALVAAVDTDTQLQCARKCDPRDSCCIAKCYQTPCPNDSQVEDTHNCIAACPQGTGTPADTQKFADCEKRCIDTHYMATANAAAVTTFSSTTTSSTIISGTTVSGTTVSTTTTSGKPASDTTVSGNHTIQTDATTHSDSTSSEESDSASGSSSHTSAAHTNAAANINLCASSVGILGIMLAAFVL
ncbi:uncharacterized protein N7503_006119 [Penicillium pulvis]|uniref:uncharacterized protein n=1 Tax=Penicillium pulvis TaxID=1562058 RepID=UPI0025492E20|nr:uncharacterized protein N7503_006119 [Penicillium pulvis]KAJ5803669.1 hypothetical protein N7503_006119 [Penicillium pulvis]